jgi:hypothetical protein
VLESVFTIFSPPYHHRVRSSRAECASLVAATGRPDVRWERMDLPCRHNHKGHQDCIQVSSYLSYASRNNQVLLRLALYTQTFRTSLSPRRCYAWLMLFATGSVRSRVQDVEGKSRQIGRTYPYIGLLRVCCVLRVGACLSSTRWCQFALGDDVVWQVHIRPGQNLSPERLSA